jgi:hydrogenase maturation protein HypF
VPLAAMIESGTIRQVVALARGSEWPLASGAGRVFEAAGALLGLAPVNRYEGEAAARLEALASAATEPPEVWSQLAVSGSASMPTLPSSELLATVAERTAAGEDPAVVAAGFHATFCALAAEITAMVAGTAGRVVALGGGCLINRLLSDGLSERLEAAGHEALLPRRMPPGDGGLSYGQAVVAVVAEARGVEPRQL